MNRHRFQEGFYVLEASPKYHKTLYTELLMRIVNEWAVKINSQKN